MNKLNKLEELLVEVGKLFPTDDPNGKLELHLNLTQEELDDICQDITDITYDSDLVVPGPEPVIFKAFTIPFVGTVNFNVV